MSGPASEWWGRRPPLLRVGVVVGCALVALGVIGLVAEARTPANRPAVNAARARAFRNGAFDACEGFVRHDLEVPATALFRGNVQVVKGASSGEWVVRGSVDAENGFGVGIHEQYTCTMLTTDTGGWASERVTFTP